MRSEMGELRFALFCFVLFVRLFLCWSCRFPYNKISFIEVTGDKMPDPGKCEDCKVHTAWRGVHRMLFETRILCGVLGKLGT